MRRSRFESKCQRRSILMKAERLEELEILNVEARAVNLGHGGINT